MKYGLIGPHIAHCCYIHGCKYGNLNCLVASGKIAQEYPCEFCPDMQEDEQMELAYLLNEMYDKGKIAGLILAGVKPELFEKVIK